MHPCKERAADEEHLAHDEAGGAPCPDRMLCSAGIACMPPSTMYLYSIYWTIATVTSVGYGDYYPETNAGKLFTCFYALIGITVLTGYHAGARTPSLR